MHIIKNIISIYKTTHEVYMKRILFSTLILLLSVQPSFGMFRSLRDRVPFSTINSSAVTTKAGTARKLFTSGQTRNYSSTASRSWRNYIPFRNTIINGSAVLLGLTSLVGANVVYAQEDQEEDQNIWQYLPRNSALRECTEIENSWWPEFLNTKKKSCRILREILQEYRQGTREGEIERDTELYKQVKKSIKNIKGNESDYDYAKALRKAKYAKWDDWIQEITQNCPACPPQMKCPLRYHRYQPVNDECISQLVSYLGALSDNYELPPAWERTEKSIKIYQIDGELEDIFRYKAYNEPAEDVGRSLSLLPVKIKRQMVVHIISQMRRHPSKLDSFLKNSGVDLEELRINPKLYL